MQLDVSALGIDLAALAPVLIVGGAAMMVLLLGLVVDAKNGWVLVTFSLAGLMAAAWSVLAMGGGRVAFGGMLAVDGLSTFTGLLSVGVAALAVLLSASYVERVGLAQPEYYGLLLFGASGMLVMAGATNLITLIIGLELLSLSLYVLAGFARTRLTSEEAALKYFLLGSFALALLIYGTALIYGEVGSLDYADIARVLREQGASTTALLGFGLLLVGFGFKLSLVPFHMWVPDVYEGAPTPVTAYMAVGTKAVVFAALLRLLVTAFPTLSGEWTVILSAMAAVTVVVANVAAVAQSNLKRLLGYSAISHAGYLMMAVVADGSLGSGAVLFYLVAYTAMNFGAFAVLVAVGEGREERLALEDYAGLARRSPWLAAAMAFFMLSLGGAPFTAGFLAKLYVFSAAVQGGFLWLAVVGAITSVVAFYYYLRVVVAMYMAEPREKLVLQRPSLSMAAVVVLALLLTLQMGILPGLSPSMSVLSALLPGI